MLHAYFYSTFFVWDRKYQHSLSIFMFVSQLSLLFYSRHVFIHIVVWNLALFDTKLLLSMAIDFPSKPVYYAIHDICSHQSHACVWCMHWHSHTFSYMSCSWNSSTWENGCIWIEIVIFSICLGGGGNGKHIIKLSNAISYLSLTCLSVLDGMTTPYDSCSLHNAK